MLLEGAVKRGTLKVVVQGVTGSKTLSAEVIESGRLVDGVIARAVGFQKTSKKPLPS